jgi:putative Mn2+ efflux pump MntP
MLLAALRVALVAVSLALDVFAVCVGIGMRGVSRGAMFRIGGSFAAAEVSMNLVGAGLGAVVGGVVGGVAAYIGFAALIGVGGYMIVETSREGKDAGFDLSRGWGLLTASLSISLDSLGIGFSIVYIGVPLVVTLCAIAAASLASTALGLGFGRRLGAGAGERAGIAAGIVLILTGVAFALLKYFNAG